MTVMQVNLSGTIIMSPSEMSMVVNPDSFHDAQVWASLKVVGPCLHYAHWG
jgi:hypothetical protein